MRPGDIYTSSAGKKVEISHTDAEGRLLLADAMELANNYHPSLIIDFATLTGAARGGVRRRHSCLF
jgi:leucyl aminopeptidase